MEQFRGPSRRGNLRAAEADAARFVVKKFRYSGFYGTQLENLLRALGRDTTAITGGATNVCCDSTARDGAMRDFKVVFLSDCSASFSPEEQDATLKDFREALRSGYGLAHICRAHLAMIEIGLYSYVQPQPES